MLFQSPLPRQEQGAGPAHRFAYLQPPVEDSGRTGKNPGAAVDHDFPLVPTPPSQGGGEMRHEQAGELDRVGPLVYLSGPRPNPIALPCTIVLFS